MSLEIVRLLRQDGSAFFCALYDCPAVPVGPDGVSCRVVVATHPAGEKKRPVGVTRSGVVYELFFSRLPQQAFTSSDARRAVSASWRLPMSGVEKPMAVCVSCMQLAFATIALALCASNGNGMAAPLLNRAR